MRLRPSNFPAIRIAQFARLIHQSNDLFNAVLRCNDPKEMSALFSVHASSYWDTHFVFGKCTSIKPKLLGTESIRLLTINVVTPFLFLYGEVKSLSLFKERGLSLLEQLPAEHNSDMVHWKEIGVSVLNAMHTQALLHLKSQYCDKKRCLDCRIGNQLLRG